MLPAANATAATATNPRMAKTVRMKWSLERDLCTRLEEVRAALDAEAVELRVPVVEFHAQVVGQVPVDHGRDAPELPAIVALRVVVLVAPAEHRFERAVSPVEHR